MNSYKISVIPGDGVGKDVMDEAVKVLGTLENQGYDISFDFVHYPWGCGYYLETGMMMPENGIEILKGSDAILLGAVGDPAVPDHISLRGLLFKIRREMKQYVNVRPIKLLNGIRSPLEGRTSEDIDMLFIRENSEGEYSGIGYFLFPGEAEETAVQNSVFTRRGCERIMEYAFRKAEKLGKSVTSISKANALNYSMVLWDKVFKEVAESHPSVPAKTVLVDAAAMFMVKEPDRFEVVVASNLFGDILTDLGAGISGGMGIAAGANLNPEKEFPSMFEPIHGSAPDIAGKGLANPIASVWSAAMMLEHLGEYEAADAVMKAIETTIVNGTVTPDLGGSCTTSEVGDAIARNIPARG